MTRARGQVVTTFLEEAEMARVDALAAEQSVTREAMIALLVQAGLEARQDTAPTESERRLIEEGAS